MVNKSHPFDFETLVSSIKGLHDHLVAQAGKAVNISLTLRNWAIGCYIREYEQNGADRAHYGKNLLENLAIRLQNKGMKRVAARELRRYRQFYLIYPQIWQSATAEYHNMLPPELLQLPAPIRESLTPILQISGNIMTDSDNPPVGILLCTQKDHALVEYAIAGMDNNLFVSRYQLQLPGKEEIKRFLEEKMREVIDWE
ncbi:MAG: PDDEXK nuclease domain-containing protein [Candidatus Auribacterota bacterium]|nr:PDDEXK nuclease domain-containing protein [Candidatus Auribacterota bacterium]